MKTGTRRPCQHLDFRLQPSELRENAFLSFYTTQFVVTCSCSPRKPTHHADMEGAGPGQGCVWPGGRTQGPSTHSGRWQSRRGRHDPAAADTHWWCFPTSG